MILALALEAALGWPDWLYRRIGHPVTWIGRLITRLDHSWNGGQGEGYARALGALTVVIVVGLCTGVGWALQAVLPGGLIGACLLAFLATPLLASRSMWVHVAAVAAPLEIGDTHAARREVAKVVGRDPDGLDEAGITRATLESLAENSSDGVVAPFFWGVILGLPGIAAYKYSTCWRAVAHRRSGMSYVRMPATTAPPMRAGRRPLWQAPSPCALRARAAMPAGLRIWPGSTAPALTPQFQISAAG